jgi:hypothetical protein
VEEKWRLLPAFLKVPLTLTPMPQPIKLRRPQLHANCLCFRSEASFVSTSILSTTSSTQKCAKLFTQTGFYTRPPLTLVPSAHFNLTPESEPAVRRVTCEEVDPNFFLYYHDIRLGVPSFDAEMCTFKTTPQECRLRDLTFVIPHFTRGKKSHFEQLQRAYYCRHQLSPRP